MTEFAVGMTGAVLGILLCLLIGAILTWAERHYS